MQKIYESLFLLIHSLTKLCGICHKYNTEPKETTGEELIKIVNNCEKKFLKVKENIVIMVKSVKSLEDKEISEHKEILVSPMKSGFLINNKD